MLPKKKSVLISHNKSTIEPSEFISAKNSRNGQYRLQTTSGPRNKLIQFEQQLRNMAITKNKRNNSQQIKGGTKKVNKIDPRLLPLALSQIRQQVGQLKSKLFYYRKQNQLHKNIWQTLPSKLKQIKTQNSINLPYITPYYYNPYPFPPSFYPPYPKQRRYTRLSDSQEQEQQAPRKKSKKFSPKRKLNKMQKQRLGKILRKTFRAVVYYFYLRKLAKLISKKRKIIFNKFWPENLQKSTNGMRKWFSASCKKFFDEMIRKSDTEIQIDGDQSQKEVNQKQKTIKSLIKILIDCLQDLVSNQTFEQIAKILHIFCKHGAFIDNGVLTPEEIETVCISDVHGYLRLDRNLQKSQIINVLLIKIIVYNMLLQPWKYNSQIFDINQNKQAYQNFYYISSVFYDLVLDVQQSLIEKLGNQNNLIQIGNWSNLKTKFKIKCSPSLCHLDSNYEQGEIISGLVSGKTIKASFDMDFWNEQLIKLAYIVDIMHNKLRKIHAQFVNQVYNYKDVSKFEK